MSALKAIGLSFILVAGSFTRANAFFDFKSIFTFHHDAPSDNRPHTTLEGMKTQSFVLHQAQAKDLALPFQRYLDGVKSQGFVIVDSVKNTLVITDFPENLSRETRLVDEMDIAYDNPNSAAREMLAMQQMMKAIRAIGPAPETAMRQFLARRSGGGSSETSANAPTVLGVTPLSGVGAFSTPIDSESEKKYKYLEDHPTISGFRVLGWISDHRGPIVVLVSQDQRRYIYRDGHIISGRSFYDTDYIKGMRAHVSHDHLIIEDVHQGTVSLNMIPQDSDDMKVASR